MPGSLSPSPLSLLFFSHPHLVRLNDDVSHSFRDALARFNQLGLRALFHQHLRMPSSLHIRGQFLVAGLPGAASTARDAHGTAKQPGDDGTQAALHPRATTAGERVAIGSAAGPSPAGAAVTCLGRQLRVFVSASLRCALSFSFHFTSTSPRNDVAKISRRTLPSSSSSSSSSSSFPSSFSASSSIFIPPPPLPLPFFSATTATSSSPSSSFHAFSFSRHRVPSDVHYRVRTLSISHHSCTTLGTTTRVAASRD